MESFKSNPSFLPWLKILVISISHFALLTSAKCSTMKVLTEQGQLTDMDVCLREYVTHDCLDFTKDFNVSLLPEEDMRGLSASRPGSLHVIEKMSKQPLESGRIGYFPGLKFNWQSPASQFARPHIKGFFIWIKSDDNEQQECRIFSINHTLYENQKLDFEYYIPQISAIFAHNYTIRLYSLPPPSGLINMDNREHFQSILVTTTKPYSTESNAVQDPADWVPGITYVPNDLDRSIDVTFTLPEPELNYGFTNYTVKLVKGDDLNSFKTNKVYINPNDNITVGHTKFTDLPHNAAYRVVMYAVDPFFDDYKCLCYKMEGFEVFYPQCQSCNMKTTSTFDLHGNVNPIIVTQPPTTADTVTSGRPSETSEMPSTITSEMPSTITSEISSEELSTPRVAEVVNKKEGSDSNDLPLIFGVSLSVTVVVIISIVACLYWKRQSDNKDNSDITPRTLPSPRPQVVITGCPKLTRKTVYLLSSSDHEYHQVLIKKFVDFLQVHCLCDVIMPSEWEANQHQGGSASWLANKLTRCDDVIFFDSIGANHRLVAFCNDERYKAKESGPEGDLFNLGLKHIYNELISKNMGSQVILVSFSEELSKKLLLLSSEYVLPKYLTPFLQRLHNFGPNSVSTYKSQVPLMPSFLPQLQEYTALQEAIKDVNNFEQQYPEWFSSHFELEEKEKPKMDRFTSIPSTTSDYSSLHGPRSVTPTFEGGSSNPSPISDSQDFPDFKQDDIPSCITIGTYPNSSQSPDEWNGPTHHVVPPLKTLGVKLDDGFSSALRFINQNNTDAFGVGSQQGCNQTGNEISPPRNDMPIGRDDSVSHYLRKLNVSETDFQKADIVPPRDLTNLTQGCNQTGNKVVPPRNDLPIGNDDSVSHYLRKLNSNETDFQKADIVPPRDLTNLTQNDTFSTVLRTINSGEKFVPALNSNSPQMENAEIRSSRNPTLDEENDTVSSILRDMNSQWKNSSSSNAIESHPTRSGMETIILPPRNPEPYSCISRDLNSEASRSKDLLMQKVDTHQIIPPKTPETNQQSDSFSNILRNMNSESNGVFTFDHNKGDSIIDVETDTNTQDSWTFQDIISVHI